MKRINRSVEVETDEEEEITLMGVLDIYGFEVFGVNRYVKQRTKFKQAVLVSLEKMFQL